MSETRALVPWLDAYARYSASAHARPAVRAALRGWGAILPWLPAASPQLNPTDMLLLSPSASWARRIGDLEKALTARGIAFKHVVRVPERRLIRARLFRPPLLRVPMHWRHQAGYAEYLFTCYRPKLVVTFTDAEPLSLFLKLSAEARQARVVNVSHAVLVPHPLKSMFAFDYYLVYGDSSVQNAQRCDVRFGSTKLVKTGSVTIPPHFVASPGTDPRRVLFFSTWLYHGRSAWARAYDEAATASMETVAAWARRSPDYRLTVKLHPDESPELVSRIMSGIPNVTILPREVAVGAALRDSTIAIGLVTNAAIDAALLGRPFVLVFSPEVLKHHLDIERFFGLRVSTPEALEARLRVVGADFERYVAACDAFVRHHLEHREHGVERTADCLAAIMAGREDFPVYPVAARMDGLWPWRQGKA